MTHQVNSNETNGVHHDVQVGTCTAKNLLFSQNEDKEPLQCQLTIPEYQRPYRWGRHQITRLLADIAVHGKREDERLSKLSKAGKVANRLPYYLGSVILHRDKKNKTNVLNIIDGQQRITSLALLAMAKSESKLVCKLEYYSPVSQRQIMANLQWLKDPKNPAKDGIPTHFFDQLEFTLVITDSEDDAYAFFETQNTGGVRLSGPDIVKAHHLRSADKNTVNALAMQWEGMGNLNPVVDALLRGRYWRGLGFRDYPRHNQPTELRTQIVSELAELTDEGDDTAYCRVALTRHPDGGESEHKPFVGYELRQPLNSGANTIHYLQFFEELRQQYLVGPMPESAREGDFHYFYHELVCRLSGCSYLKQLFDACLLMYISQFGEQRLYPAAVKMFRVVYSRRVENRSAVRELSVSSFVKETPVLDWIALSYTSAQCLALFDGFELTVSKDGLGDKDYGVKKRFVLEVDKHLGLNSADQQGNFADIFCARFSENVIAL